MIIFLLYHFNYKKQFERDQLELLTGELSQSHYMPLFGESDSDYYSEEQNSRHYSPMRIYHNILHNVSIECYLEVIPGTVNLHLLPQLLSDTDNTTTIDWKLVKLEDTDMCCGSSEVDVEVNRCGAHINGPITV